jgi:hypothetical protein
MNEAFMEMGKSLMPVFQTITDITLLIAENIKAVGVLVGLYGTVNTILLAQKILKAQGNKEAIKELLTGKSRLAQLAAQAVAFALANPFKALLGVAAAATIGGIAYSAMSKADDMISLPSGGGQGGYGSRILTGPEGSVALNNKDTIVAGTSLDQGGGGNASSAKLEQLQAQTNNLLSQLLNKNASIRMDSEELGTAISLNNYEVSA